MTSQNTSKAAAKKAAASSNYEPADTPDLDGAASETAASSESSPKTTRVTLAVDQTTRDGVDHKADDTVDLPRSEARLLIHQGRARLADSDAPTTEQQGSDADASDGSTN